jgi:hypothetical protein
VHRQTLRAPLIKAAMPVDLAATGMVRGLSWWGMINLWLVFSQILLPPNNFGWKVLGATFVSMILWIPLAIGSQRVPLRLPAPIAFLLLLQIWTFVCAIYAQFSVGQYLVVTRLTGFYLLYVLGFVQGGCLVWFFPECRKLVIWTFIGMVGLSSVVAYLQFLRFGPAIELSRHYNPMPIDNWGGRGGVRAFGLYGQLHHATIACLTAATLIAGNLLHRSLKRWELALTMFFLGAALMAQSRTVYLAIGVFVVLIAALYVRREREKAFFPMLFFALLLVAMFVVFYDRFAYLFSTFDFQRDASLVYRQERGWVQAMRIYEIAPWTGIGPSGLLAVGTGDIGYQSKFFTGANLDNGYLMILAFSGLPGLALWLLFGATALVGVVRLAWSRSASEIQRVLALAVALSFSAVGLTMLMGNVISNVPPNLLVTFLAGIALSSKQEDLEQRRRTMRRSPVASRWFRRPAESS